MPNSYKHSSLLSLFVTKIKKVMTRNKILKLNSFQVKNTLAHIVKERINLIKFLVASNYRKE
jgi:hypothetical protein